MPGDHSYPTLQVGAWRIDPPWLRESRRRARQLLARGALWEGFVVGFLRIGLFLLLLLLAPVRDG